MLSKNAKKHAIVEMWLALAATNKKVGAYNSTSKLIYEDSETSEWVAKRDICHKSFQDMLEATSDHVAHTYIIRDIFIAGYLILQK